VAAIEGLFLNFLDDSLGHDKPDALMRPEPIYFSMPVTEAGTNVPFRVGESPPMMVGGGLAFSQAPLR
jgi:hypothetical protein